MSIKNDKKTGSKKTEKISGKKTAGISEKSALKKSSGTGKKSEPAKTVTVRSSKSEEAPKNSAVAQPTRKVIRKTPDLPARTRKTPVSKKKPEKPVKERLKIYLPQEEYDTGPLKASFPELPEEYGENELILMEVDPSVVFVSWEVKPDEVARKAGRLNLRVYDVTGSDVNSSRYLSDTGRFFDIPVRNRVDSKFYELKMSGKEVVMEIGLLHGKRKFKPITRSNRISIPELYDLEKTVSKRPEDTDKAMGY